MIRESLQIDLEEGDLVRNTWYVHAPLNTSEIRTSVDLYATLYHEIEQGLVTIFKERSNGRWCNHSELGGGYLLEVQCGQETTRQRIKDIAVWAAKGKMLHYMEE